MKTGPKYIEVNGVKVPEPSFDYRVDLLIREYKAAMKRLQVIVKSTDIADMERANAVAMLSEIQAALYKLDLFAEQWVKENIPAIVEEGAIATMLELGVATSVAQAKQIVKFNRLNEAFVEAAVADLQTDLLELTKNTSKRVRNTVRKITGEVLRAKYSQGENSTQSISKELKNRLRAELGKAAESGIVYSNGRVVSVNEYVPMIVRTKAMEAYREAKTNEAIEREAAYAIISSVGSKDACRFHEGRIIKLDPNAPGNYPTYDQLKASGQIFHPRCRHHFTVIRNLERLPDSVKETAETQSKRGNAALEIGGRSPKID